MRRRGVVRGTLTRVLVRTWRIAAVACCLPLQAVVAQSAVGGPGARPDVQVGVVTRPDTVTVGDPFTIVVRVRVPSNAQVVWPEITDTTATIAPREAMLRRDGPADISGREEFAEYPLAAWDTGQLATNWPAVLVVTGTDTVSVSLAEAGVYVRSVLPADTLEHVPRPPKPPFGRVVPWWQRWWPALLVLVGLLVVAWMRWRRGRRKRVAMPAAVRLTAFDHAMHAFDRLERLALSDAGEFGRATTLAMDIVRGYLAVRIPVTSRAQTSAELLAVMGDDPRVPITALIQLLVVTDAVKFARRDLGADETRTISRSARALVEAIEQAERDRLAALQPPTDNGPVVTDDSATAPANAPTDARETSGVR